MMVKESLWLSKISLFLPSDKLNFVVIILGPNDEVKVRSCCPGESKHVLKALSGSMSTMVVSTRACSSMTCGTLVICSSSSRLITSRSADFGIDLEPCLLIFSYACTLVPTHCVPLPGTASGACFAGPSFPLVGFLPSISSATTAQLQSCSGLPQCFESVRLPVFVHHRCCVLRLPDASRHLLCSRRTRDIPVPV